jgi:hypothetical protein
MTNPESDSPPPINLPPAAPPPKKHGCFFYGCITSLILLLLLAVALLFVTRFLLNRVNQLVAQYSDAKPMTLESVELPPAEMKALLDRITAFSDALDAHSNAAPLILTAPQVNALLDSRPELARYKGQFLVSFDGTQTKAQISLPLESLPKLPMVDTKGRYLNGSGTFNLAINNGVLSVFVVSLEAKGKLVPAQALGNLQRVNLAESANQGPATNSLQQIENLQVTNSTLVIQPKNN